MNTLKLGISLTALEVVHETLMICGMAGYKHNIDYSVGCHLRDLFSAPLMISNDRIQLNTANLLLAQRTPATGKIQDMNALTEHAAIAAADAQQVSTCNASDITLRDRLIEAESEFLWGDTRSRISAGLEVLS